MSGSGDRVLAFAGDSVRAARRGRLPRAFALGAVAVGGVALGAGALVPRDAARVTRDFGLGGLGLATVATALALGAALVPREVERRWAHTFLPKPIGRWELVAGRFAGLAALLALEVALFGAALALALAVAPSFGSDAVAAAALVRALLLAWAEAVLVAALALLLGSLASPLVAGGAALGLFVAGRSHQALAQLGAHASGPLARRLVAAGLGLVPDLGLFQRGDAGWGYVACALGYGLAYAAGAVALAAWRFTRQDIA